MFEACLNSIQCLSPDTARDVYTSPFGYTLNLEIKQGANRAELIFFFLGGGGGGGSFLEKNLLETIIY